MKLTELQPKFLRHELRVDGEYHVRVDSIDQATGIMFLCPKCFAEKDGPRGVHSVICWSRSRGTPDSAQPNPGRWAMVGTSFDDLTLNADPPATARSVVLLGDCGWHGFITNGEVTTV